MAKKITHNIKLNIPAGKGNPAPPVGPALGQAGINMMEFLKKFNEQTMPQMGFILPVQITVFEDRSYNFVVKQPLTSELIKKELGITTASQTPGKNIVAKLTKEQVRKIAQAKMADLNTKDEAMAMRIVAGTARSMGIDAAL